MLNSYVFGIASKTSILVHCSVYCCNSLTLCYWLDWLIVFICCNAWKCKPSFYYCLCVCVCVCVCVCEKESPWANIHANYPLFFSMWVTSTAWLLTEQCRAMTRNRTCAVKVERTELNHGASRAGPFIIVLLKVFSTILNNMFDRFFADLSLRLNVYINITYADYNREHLLSALCQARF